MLFLPQESLADNVFCFTTSVHGGVSNNAYTSFNLGMHVGDNTHRVLTNRQLLNAIIKQQVVNRTTTDEPFTLAPIQWLNQQHSTIVRNYSDSMQTSQGIQEESAVGFQNDICDGIYTTLENTPLAVMSADCLPIVIACANSGQIAAIHAGWRGLISGILGNALAKFSDTSALSVWIGPCISKAHFEISPDISEQFRDYEDALTYTSQTNKYSVDLIAIAKRQLLDLGVTAIQTSQQCTYANEHCFSHRRATHQGLTQTGRMATVIIRL